jgi:hypothetical protein
VLGLDEVAEWRHPARPRGRIGALYWRHFSVPRLTQLDKQWQELMSLCAREKEFRTENRHLKLVRFISERIEQLAAEMGFSDRLIRSREFRAEKDGDHISRIITE